MVRASPTLDGQGNIPLTFDFAERARHAVTATIAFSTDLGGSAGVTWSHRNLFGNAEQLNLAASITGLGGSATKGVGYDVTAQLIKPDFLRRDQQLEFDLGAIKQQLDAYDQTAFTAGTTLSRKLSRQWTVSVGLTGEQEQIIQQGVTRDYTLVAVPVTGKFDSTGLSNPLDDATHGIRATLGAVPTESLGTPGSTFVVLQGSASTYVDFASFGWTRPGHSVLALRGLVGSAEGATQFQLPPDQRFYGGGSATVRGFKYQSVGPLFADGNPRRRRRHRFRDHRVPATDLGQYRRRGLCRRSPGGCVQRTIPGHVTGRRGRRRALLHADRARSAWISAVPLNEPPHGDSFELYLGLGQAF